MKQLQNQRLAKAITILSVVLFLLVSSSIFLTYYLFTNQLKGQLASTNMELLRQLNDKLELVLRQIDFSAVSLIASEEVIHFYDRELGDAESLNNEVRISNNIYNVINSNRYILSIDMYSYPKQKLVTGNDLTEQELMQNYQWIAEFQQFEGYMDWMTTRRLTLNRAEDPIFRNVVTLVRTYPLIHKPGARKGAIAVNLKEEMLYDLIRNATAEEKGQTFIIDGDGVVVLHADKSKLGKDISEFPYIRRILDENGAEGAFSADVEQTKSTLFYARTKQADWKIVHVMPEAELIRPLSIIRKGLILLAVVLFLVATASATVVGRWTFKPVNRFIQAMTNHLKKDARGPAFRKYSDEFQYFESTVQHILEDRNLLNKQFNESKPMIKWQLLKELLTSRRKSATALQPYMDMLGLSLHGGHFVVMSVEFDNKNEIPTPRDLQLYSYALCNVAEELMNAESKGIAAEMDNGKCVVVMSFEDEGDGERHAMRAEAVADLMKDFAREYFNRTITIGIGNAVSGLGDIHQSYKQSLDALGYKLVLGGNSIITMEDITNEPSPQYYRLFGMTDGMVQSVKLLDRDKLRQQVAKWFEAFSDNNVRPEMIRQLIVQCLMKAATAAAEIGVDPSELFPEEGMYEMLGGYEQLEQLERFTMEALERYMASIQAKRSGREKNDVIDKVLRYLEQHYMRSDLSLNLLASEFHISVSHLSKLFKEQEECNFIDYLMDIRMNRAKALLTDSEAMIKDIAEQVGYTNVNSFVRLFKKTTGLTPTEFRQRNKPAGQSDVSEVEL
ncbi:helix-turn-helix domain-containing protein [Paenibacillus arenilitoris]|uniref:AraC family transcriptional regulator n=1 Tax=Paenibacillus arenilitoris TaxID=2772299 RepID=A0A927H7Z9_9BACL|nr:helix-turn-helix domain-containing protein [Paenibacillus arenilitoris]MBD2872176.1 AraC family transcriptional regulator [Paenibacillus arenilitoris]